MGSRGVLAHCFREAFGVMRLASKEPHLQVQRGNNSSGRFYLNLINREGEEEAIRSSATG
jgi:hypothetical protein